MTKDEIKLEYYTALKNLDYLYLNSVMLRALSEEMLKVHNGIIINVSMRPVVKSVCRFCGGSPIEDTGKGKHCPYCDKYW